MEKKVCGEFIFISEGEEIGSDVIRFICIDPCTINFFSYSLKYIREMNTVIKGNIDGVFSILW